MRSTGSCTRFGQREVAPRQVARVLLGLGELTVLVVALDQGDAEEPDRLRLRTRDDDHAGEQRDQRAAPRPRVAAHENDTRGRNASARSAFVATIAYVIERESADARDVAGDRNVVQRVSGLTPREPLEREPRDHRVGDDPHRRGQPR